MRRRLKRSISSPMPTRPTDIRSQGQAVFNAEGNTNSVVSCGSTTRGTGGTSGARIAAVGAISGLGTLAGVGWTGGAEGVTATLVGSMVTLTAGGLVRPSVAGATGRTSVKTAATAPASNITRPISRIS